jgi:transposase
MILASVALRELAPEERQTLEQLASSRTAQARFVERARILAIADGRRPGQVAKDLGLSRPTVYTWIHRFNDQGLHGLEDRPRAGRPHTYTAEQRAEVISSALTDPRSLGLPFACWTLDRLQAYLNEQKASRSSAAGSTSCCRPKACGGDIKRPGSASGSIPPSPKKGGHRAVLHEPAGGLGRRLPRRDGSPESAKSFPGQQLVHAEPRPQAGGSVQPAGRAKQEIDYGRRGKGTSSARSARRPVRR